MKVNQVIDTMITLVKDSFPEVQEESIRPKGENLTEAINELKKHDRVYTFSYALQFLLVALLKAQEKLNSEELPTVAFPVLDSTARIEENICRIETFGFNVYQLSTLTRD